MEKIDRKLIYLKEYLKVNKFQKKEVAGYLEVTERHLSRLLNRWNEEGLIIYEQGNGRGNNSIVHFIKDIEELLIDEYLLNLSNHSIEVIYSVLSLPISDEAKEVIKNNVTRHLLSPSKNNMLAEESFTDYYYGLPKSIEDPTSCDFSTMTLRLNTANRLYEVNSEGVIKKSLVRFDEWDGNTLIIYLRKDIKFSNGGIMSASTVIESIKRMLKNEDMSYLNRYIISIDRLDTFKLSITLTQRYEIIKYIFSKSSSSIYTMNNNQILTTGPYFIDWQDDKTIMLKRNSYYFGKAGDISKIEMTTDVKRYTKYLKRNRLENISVLDRSCIEYIMLNPASDKLNLKERQYLMYLINNYLKDYNYPAFEDKKVLDDDVYFPDGDEIKITGTLKIVFSNQVSQPSEFINFLKQYNIQAIIVPDEDGLEVADIYFGRSFTEKLFFFNMLRFETFGKWFKPLQESIDLLEEYSHGNAEHWEDAEIIYEKKLYDNAYFIPIYRPSRQVNIPEGFKNLRTNSYSTVKFNQFVVKRDEHVR